MNGKLYSNFHEKKKENILSSYFLIIFSSIHSWLYCILLSSLSIWYQILYHYQIFIIFLFLLHILCSICVHNFLIVLDISTTFLKYQQFIFALFVSSACLKFLHIVFIIFYINARWWKVHPFYYQQNNNYRCNTYCPKYNHA